MIKVNFNQKKGAHTESRSKGLAPTGTSQFLSQITEAIKENEAVLDTTTLIKFAINFAIVLTFPIGLKIYEMKEIKKLETKKQQEQSILDQKKQQLAQLKKELEKYAYLEELSKEFQSKKDFLRGISSNRLLVPSTMDIIQNQIPQKKLWLNDLKIQIEKDGGAKLSLSGASLKEADINTFTRNLENIIDPGSILVSTKDVKDGRSESIIKIDFNLTGQIIRR